LLCLPTGAGKTFTAVRFLKESSIDKHSHIFYWTAHLRELLQQAEETVRSVFGEEYPIVYWDAKNKPDISKLEPGTFVLTQIQSTRTFENTSSYASILIVDETHREAAKSYRDFEEKLNPNWKIGLTATPYRLDKKDLDYDKIAAQETLLSLAAQGWLATPKYVKVSTDRNYELHIQGDFTKAALEQLGSDLCRAELIAKHYHDNQKQYQKAIVFCPSIESSEKIAKELIKKGVKAASLSGKDDRVYRDAVINDFKNGKLDVLTNVQLFTEGFDSKDIRTVILARPTLSKSLWLQAVGRGARVSPPLVPPASDHFYVVDFVDNVKMYPLVAEQFSVELLNAPKSEAQLKREEEEEALEKLEEKAESKQERDMVSKLAKKGRVLDIIGYMRVTNLPKSKKNGKREWRSYPIFKQELPIFRSMLKHIETRIGKEELYTFIHSSYERGGNQTNLTKTSWIDLSWSMFHHHRS
jgi:superfamily II DNA or RNA helicase